VVAQTLPAIDPAAPGWFQRWASRLPDFYALRNPLGPVRIATYANTAALPDPAKFQGCLVFNTALGAPCISNGTYWFPVTLGAHL
jgi:hypothetical protein